MWSSKFITKVTQFGFLIGCIFLYVIALGIFAVVVWSIVVGLYNETFGIDQLLDEVALIVFAIAVVDVSKYLMLEEVVKGGANRSHKEERQMFSRFIIIMVTALSLEGFVLTIETAKSEVRNLGYPILIFIPAMVFMIGLGLYQRYNAIAEKDEAEKN